MTILSAWKRADPFCGWIPAATTSTNFLVPSANVLSQSSRFFCLPQARSKKSAKAAVIVLSVYLDVSNPVVSLQALNTAFTRHFFIMWNEQQTPGKWSTILKVSETSFIWTVHLSRHKWAGSESSALLMHFIWWMNSVTETGYPYLIYWYTDILIYWYTDIVIYWYKSILTFSPLLLHTAILVSLSHMNQNHVEYLSREWSVALGVFLKTLHVLCHYVAMFLHVWIVSRNESVSITFKQQRLRTSICSLNRHCTIRFESCLKKITSTDNATFNSPFIVSRQQIRKRMEQRFELVCFILFSNHVLFSSGRKEGRMTSSTTFERTDLRQRNFQSDLTFFNNYK